MAVIVVAAPEDATALRVAALLARRGRVPVTVRTLEELLLARWRYEVTDAGAAAEITTHDGGRLPDGPGAAAVFWRARAVYHPGRFDAADRDYAGMESLALLLSWLAGFGARAVNRPSPAGFGGGAPSALAWRRLAAQAGLRAGDLAATTSTRRFPPAPGATTFAGGVTADPLAAVPGDRFLFWSPPPPGPRVSALAIGGEVEGAPSPQCAAACAELARLAGTELLRIDFAADTRGGEPMFLGAEPHPDLADPRDLLRLALRLEALAA